MKKAAVLKNGKSDIVSFCGICYNNRIVANLQAKAVLLRGKNRIK